MVATSVFSFLRHLWPCGEKHPKLLEGLLKIHRDLKTMYSCEPVRVNKYQKRSLGLLELKLMVLVTLHLSLGN